MCSVSEIIEIFSERYIQIVDKCTEDFYTLSLLYKADSFKNLIPQHSIDENIPSRDCLSINIYDSLDIDDDVILAYNSSKNNWNEFWEDYLNLDKSISRLIKIEVSKDNSYQEHSIYSFELFSSYLESSNPFSILGQLCKFVNSSICIFEFQEDQIPSFSTSKFHFHGKSKKIIQSISEKSIEARKRCINKAGFLCSSTELKGDLLPDDIFPITIENYFLKRIFNRLSTLYSLCFLLDYTHADNTHLKFKLNGFKSIEGKWDLSQEINEKTANIINRIYTWGYNGGDIDDKILIIRNILSLNIDADSLVLHTNTFDAILSNYKIYQKENVRQYLDLRNNIVKDIQKYQDSILHAIDNFEDSFKRVSISLLSFFFVTLILSILSFTLSSNIRIPDAVIYCCFAISLISLLYYNKEKKWLIERISYLEKRFKISKKYYEDLLGEEELSNFFEEENNEENEEIKFRNKKINGFSRIWLYSTIIIMAFLVILLIMNHVHPLSEIIYLLESILEKFSDSQA